MTRRLPIFAHIHTVHDYKVQIEDEARSASSQSDSGELSEIETSPLLSKSQILRADKIDSAYAASADTSLIFRDDADTSADTDLN